MSPQEARALRPAQIGYARPLARAVCLLLLAAVLGLVLFTALRSPLKDDIAWLLYVARAWLSGRALYVDVVEVNPPLIVWLSAIPIQISIWTGLTPQLAAIGCFVAAVLGCAWWTAGLLQRQGGIFADRLSTFAVMGAVLLLIPAGDLGQREHLLVAAVLPYLALFAGSLDGIGSSRRTAILAGIVAALGCALKPRYAGVFVILETLALMRGLRPWRAMPLAAGLTLGAYAGLVALVCPAYLRRAVPLALALYGGTDVSFLHLALDSARLLAGEAIAITLWWLTRHRLRESNLLLTLVAFAVTSTAICFIDGKDWFYHRLPATIAIVLALICWSVCAIKERHTARRRAYIPIALAGIAAIVFLIASFQRLEPQVELAVEPEQSTVARLERLIRAQHARTYIAFSEWIALGFPVVNNTGVVWASRFDSMWALKGELWRAHFDPAAAREWPIRRWVAHDFIAGCPDIAVVDTREGVNYIDVLSTSDPAFARAWSRYQPIDAFDGLVVYRRKGAGCIDPWVAAAAPQPPTAAKGPPFAR
jgi:hypothetical protein